MIIDTHCHLSKEDYDNIDEIVEHMENNIMIISGVDDKSNLEVIEYVNKYPNVYGTIGIHPENVLKITSESFKIIESNLSNPKIVGIGEIGLDYHYPDFDKEKQHQILEKQLELAKKYNKPVVIHSRDSYLDTYNILKKVYDGKLKIVFHCYSYSKESALELKKMNVKFGIGGVLTFKNGKKLREVVEVLDMSDILLETDSPYLSPEPFRGKRNEPANVKYVALKLAEIKNMAVEEIEKITTSNAITEFDLDLHM